MNVFSVPILPVRNLERTNKIIRPGIKSARLAISRNSEYRNADSCANAFFADAKTKTKPIVKLVRRVKFSSQMALADCVLLGVYVLESMKQICWRTLRIFLCAFSIYDHSLGLGLIFCH